MKEKVHWILFWLFIAAFAVLLFVVPIVSYFKGPKRERYYCPVCDAEIDYEAEPEYLEGWLNRKGYDLVYRDFVADYVNDFLSDNPDWIDDILADNAAAYLEDNGWTLIPPEGK